MPDETVTVRYMVDDMEKALSSTIVNDIEKEIRRLREEGVKFRNDVVTGPGGSQVLVQDPAGNLIELFQPAQRSGS